MKKDEIMRKLEELSHDEIVSAWNAYQAEIDGEDTIYPIYDFDDVAFNRTPSEIAESVLAEGFNPTDDYFIETVYGFKSAPWWEVDKLLCFEDLCDYIVNYGATDILPEFN